MTPWCVCIKTRCLSGYTCKTIRKSNFILTKIVEDEWNHTWNEEVIIVGKMRRSCFRKTLQDFVMWQHMMDDYMETLSTSMAFCEEIHRTPMDSPHSGLVMRVLIFAGWGSMGHGEIDEPELGLPRFKTRWRSCDVTIITSPCGCRIRFNHGSLPLVGRKTPIVYVRMSSWWRHQMETFSALLAICAGNSPVTGGFLAQRPVTRSFDVFFDLRLNKRLIKHSWCLWFGAHYDVIVMFEIYTDGLVTVRSGDYA